MMLVVGVVQSLCVQKYFQGFHIIAMKVKGALTAAIYRKVRVIGLPKKFKEGLLVVSITKIIEMV